MKDLKAAAARAKGLNSPALMRPAKPGAVYLAKDRPIALPKERLPSAGERTFHATRYVIILQAGVMCTSADPVTVTVVPCSSSSRDGAGPADYAVPADEAVFPDKSTVAYVSLMQPILKSELVEYLGDLSDEALLALQAVVLRNLGITGQASVALPSVKTLAEQPTDEAVISVDDAALPATEG